LNVNSRQLSLLTVGGGTDAASLEHCMKYRTLLEVRKKQIQRREKIYVALIDMSNDADDFQMFH
jgi:hypothetical protein